MTGRQLNSKYSLIDGFSFFIEFIEKHLSTHPAFTMTADQLELVASKAMVFPVVMHGCES